MMDDQQKQQPKDQIELNISDFLTDFNKVLEKYEIVEPTLVQELDKIKTSDSSELALFSPHNFRLKCTLEFKDGHLEFNCTNDNDS